VGDAVTEIPGAVVAVVVETPGNGAVVVVVVETPGNGAVVVVVIGTVEKLVRIAAK
jgi:hypothetical protein